MFERKYCSGRVVAKLSWIKVLVGEIRIGPGVGQRFGSPRVKAHSWQMGILVTLPIANAGCQYLPIANAGCLCLPIANAGCLCLPIANGLLPVSSYS